MIVEVTQDDIDKGQRTMPWSCPIALASARRLGYRVIVNGYGIHDAVAYTSGELLYTIAAPTKRKIHQYDATGVMRPFRFRAVKVK